MIVSSLPRVSHVEGVVPGTFRNAWRRFVGSPDVTRRQHRKLSKLVDAWVDGELDDAHTRAVAAHVSDCQDCSAAAQSTRLVKRALHARARRRPLATAAVRLRRYAASLWS